MKTHACCGWLALLISTLAASSLFAAAPALVLKDRFDHSPIGQADAMWLRMPDNNPAGTWDGKVGHAKPGSLCFSNTASWADWATPYGKLIPVVPGTAYRLTGWIKTQGATGETYLALEWFINEAQYAGAGKSRIVSGERGWTQVQAAGIVPENVQLLRIGLRSDSNSGTAWFDDIELSQIDARTVRQPTTFGQPSGKLSKRTWKPIPLAQGLPTPDPAIVKDGFVHVKDAHLYRSGQRLRLWGTNCVQEYQYSRDEQIRTLDRIRAMGFNAIRLHLYDETFIAGDDVGYNITPYTKGDDSPVDRIDHFIASAIERGFVLYMTFDRMDRPVRPEAYDLLPADAYEREWKAAAQELAETNKPGSQIERIFPFEPRIEAAFTRWVTNLLAHLNQYTGRTYAQEPGIALWEISNESNAVTAILEEGLRGSGHFHEVARQLWNDFLRQHYASDEALRTAWGDLEDGESLEDGTVRLWPLPIPKWHDYREEVPYPYHRVNDLTVFVVNRLIEANNRVLQAIRASAPEGIGANVVPVTYDTHHTLDLLNLYFASSGSFTCAGTYKCLGTFDKSDPLYPITSMTAIKPGLYGMDVSRVADKPMVTYEINVFRPAFYRAEFPLVVAAYTSAQDWDAVFWYHWQQGRDRSPTTFEELRQQEMRYASADHIWHGVVMYADELQLAAHRLAGMMFLNGAIRPSSEPARFQLGRGELLSAPMNSAFWGTVLGNATTGPGMRIAFTPDQPNGKLPNLSDLLGFSDAVSTFGPDALVDPSRRQLRIDSATCSVFAGWPAESHISFVSGLRVENMQPNQFITFAATSADGKPIAQSKHLFITALGVGENTNFVYDPSRTAEAGATGFTKAIASDGSAPVQIRNPRCSVRLPGSTAGTARFFNTVPAVYSEQTIEGTLELPADRPAGWVEITYP